MLQERGAPTVPAVRVPSVYRDPLTWAIAAVVFGGYATISLFRLLQLSPSSWDLGIFTEYVKQFAHFHAPIVNIRGAGTNLYGDHFSPAVAVLAPFFRVFPSPATLLVAQAALIAASIFPISQAARSRLGPGAARAIAIAYGFSWGLQQMINFDFHEIALAVPLLAFSLSAVVQGRVRAAVCWALPLVFVKEDQGFTVAALGLYLLISGLRTADADRGRLRAGQFLMIWGMAWSFLAIAIIIPHFNASHTYYYWGDGGAFAPGGHPSVLALFRQFFHAWPEKLQTLVLLFLPTAFVALRSPMSLIVVPSLGLRFESTNSAYWGTAWHYNATVMPILFVAAVDALARIRAAIETDSTGVVRGADVARGAGTALGAGVAVGGAGAADSAANGAANGAAAEDLVLVTDGAIAADGAAVADGSRERWGAWASGRQGWWRAAMAGAQRYGAAMMLAVTVPLAFQYPLSNLWSGQTYKISPHVAADNAAMAKVPDGTTVLTTLNMLAPLAARTDTYWIGNHGNPEADYIVFDGPDSGYSPAIANVPQFIAGLYPGHAYTQIFSDDNVYVFRRSAS
jgi:uncharacterized membrane protein